jgi:hypothetical protein
LLTSGRVEPTVEGKKADLLAPRAPNLLSSAVKILVEEMNQDIKRNVHACDADEYTVAALV